MKRSLETAIVLDDWKTAYVTPIFKKKVKKVKLKIIDQSA